VVPSLTLRVSTVRGSATSKLSPWVGGHPGDGRGRSLRLDAEACRGRTVPRLVSTSAHDRTKRRLFSRPTSVCPGLICSAPLGQPSNGARNQRQSELHQPIDPLASQRCVPAGRLWARSRPAPKGPKQISPGQRQGEFYEPCRRPGYGFPLRPERCKGETSSRRTICYAPLGLPRCRSVTQGDAHRLTPVRSALG